MSGTYIELVDCTLRDGSYQVDFGFTAADTGAMVGALDAAGVRWLGARRVRAWNSRTSESRLAQ